MADKFGKDNKRHLLTFPAVGMAIAAPILFAGYWVDDWRIAVALLIVPTILNSAYYGPAYACVQGLVRPEARAMAASMVVFGQNLIGLGMGPLLFGMLSDALIPVAGQDSVRWVLFGAPTPEGGVEERLRADRNLCAIRYQLPNLLDFSVSDGDAAIGPIMLQAFKWRPIGLAMYKNIPTGGLSFCLRKCAVSSVGVGYAQAEMIATGRVPTRDGIVTFRRSFI
eukprot:gene31575-53898_t